jgi:short-subunit dehydrogenase
MKVTKRAPGTVIITGASAGVGRATALRFARAGARVGLIARDEQSLHEVKDEIQALGGEAAVAAADVSDAAALFAAAEKLQNSLGSIDIWVNNAMVTVFSPFCAITPEEYKRVTDVTYLGFVHGTMAALRLMRPHNRGTIVQVGSALAYRGIPLQSAYCGAKHAIHGFTESLRSELIHDRSAIHVTMVNLPAMNTPQFDWARTHMCSQPRPVAPVFEPTVAAEAIFKAAQQRKREYWLGLSSVEVILANMLGPALLDRYLARTAYEGQIMEIRVSPERPDNLEKPVSHLHRTRGSFGNEARNWAIDLPGPATRAAAGAVGILCAVAVGMVLGRAMRR